MIVEAQHGNAKLLGDWHFHEIRYAFGGQKDDPRAREIIKHFSSERKLARYQHVSCTRSFQELRQRGLWETRYETERLQRLPAE